MYPVSHLVLLSVVRAVQRAAVDGHEEALHHELCRLRIALAARARQDRTTEDHGEVEHRLVRLGRERLARLLDELIASWGTASGQTCTCLVRTAELRRLLLQQLRIENRIAHHAFAAAATDPIVAPPESEPHRLDMLSECGGDPTSVCLLKVRV